MKIIKLHMLPFLLGVPTTPILSQEKSNKIVSYRVASPFQSDCTSLRVLTPDNMDFSKDYRVLYILPVIENDNRRFGDGLLEVLKLNYHNLYQLTCVASSLLRFPGMLSMQPVRTNRMKVIY